MRNIRFMLPLALACQLLAGGFWLQLGNPEANAEARRNNAVAVVKAVGCHHPETAQLSANAIGIVDGRRQSIPLKLIPLAEPATYALAQQWPREGHWVIHLVGRNGQQFTNTLIHAGPEGLDRLHPKSAMQPFDDEQVVAWLGN